MSTTLFARIARPCCQTGSCIDNQCLLDRRLPHEDLQVVRPGPSGEGQASSGIENGKWRSLSVFFPSNEPPGRLVRFSAQKVLLSHDE
jgi:hypothetical protein